MTSNRLALTLLAGAVAYISVTLAVPRLELPKAAPGSGPPAIRATATDPPAPPPEKTQKLGPAFNSADARKLKPRPGRIGGNPDRALPAVANRAQPDKSRTEANGITLDPAKILKHWEVPPLTPPQGQLYISTTPSAAIDDDGTCVMIDNHPAVDIWDATKVSCVRIQPTQDWGMTCNVILAQDASYFYVRNDATKKLDAYNQRGALTGSAPQIGFSPQHGLKRPGFDFAPGEYVLGSRLPRELGIFAIQPQSGALRLTVPIKDFWDVDRCIALVRLGDGDFLGYYVGGGGQMRPGLHIITKSGQTRQIPDTPTNDMKVVNRLSVSRDGRYLAMQGQDRLQVWDLPYREIVLDWREDYRAPLDGRFTGDGRLAVLSVKTNIKEIATSHLTGGYSNRTARLDVVDIPSLHVDGRLDLTAFEGLMPAFAFSPNGQRLVVADSKQVALVDVQRAFPGN
jgi:hypothetical protein